jgi:hypothetical protein
MPRINSNKSNIIKIEPNPKKKSSVKIKMQVLNVAGGAPKYTIGEDGSKKFKTQFVEPKNMMRLPNTVVEYCAALDSNGRLKTGLDILVKNKYNDEPFYRDGWEEILKGKEKVRLQELLEYKHDKAKGYYTSQVSDIRSSFDKDSVPFYQKPESRVNLRDGVTYLDLTNPIHEVNYYMLKAHNMVANSYEELGHNYEATHYIVDETEKIKRETGKVRQLNKAGRCLETLIELTENVIIDFCKALELRRGISSRDDAYNELDSFMKKNDENFEEFMSFYNMWEEPATREIFLGYVELFDFISTPGLITKRGNKYFWTQPAGDGGKRELWEWKSKSDLVENFITDARYRDEVDILRSQFRSKTRYEIG